jgi:hypothetical protein
MTLEVTAASLHDASDPPVAKRLFAPEGVLLHWFIHLLPLLTRNIERGECKDDDMDWMID